MNILQFIEQVQTARAELDALIVRFSEMQFLQPGAAGEWRVKDILAHVAWHEKEMVGMLQARALVGSDLWNLPLNQRNGEIFTLNKDRSLDEVRSEYSQIFPQLVLELEKLVDQDLHDPRRFPGMPEDWEPWQVIASNTYEHYQDHLADLQAFLETQV